MYWHQIGNTFRVLTACDPDTNKWNAFVITLYYGAEMFTILRTGPPHDDRIVAMIGLLQSLEVSVTELMQQGRFREYEEARQADGTFQADKIVVKVPVLPSDVGRSDTSVVQHETIVQNKSTEMAELEAQANTPSSEHNAVSSNTQEVGGKIRGDAVMNQ